MALKGCVAIVLSARDAVCAETAVHLSRAGVRVVVVDKEEERAIRVAQQCDRTAPDANRWELVGGKWEQVNRALPVTADFRCEDDCRRVVERAVERFGRIDLLVTKMSSPPKRLLVDEGLMEDFDAFFMGELRALLCVTQTAVPFLERTRGSVVHICGQSRAETSVCVQRMTESVIQMLTNCLSLECGPRFVRINAISHCDDVRDEAPNGLEVNQQLVDAFVARLQRNNPLGRLFAARDVAEAVVHLASGSAQFLNGVTLRVDGGNH